MKGSFIRGIRLFMVGRSVRHSGKRYGSWLVGVPKLQRGNFEQPSGDREDPLERRTAQRCKVE